MGAPCRKRWEYPLTEHLDGKNIEQNGGFSMAIGWELIRCFWCRWRLLFWLVRMTVETASAPILHKTHSWFQVWFSSDSPIELRGAALPLTVQTPMLWTIQSSRMRRTGPQTPRQHLDHPIAMDHLLQSHHVICPLTRPLSFGYLTVCHGK